MGPSRMFFKLNVDLGLVRGLKMSAWRTGIFRSSCAVDMTLAATGEDRVLWGSTVTPRLIRTL